MSNKAMPSSTADRPRRMRPRTLSHSPLGERKPGTLPPKRKTKSFNCTHRNSEAQMAEDNADSSFYANAYAMLPTNALSNGFFGQQQGSLAYDEDDPFQDDMNSLSYSQEDIISILNEDEVFQVLKRSLRQRGCVTNGYLKENIHLFVLHVKEIRARRTIAESRQTMRAVQRAACNNAAA